MSRSTIFLSIGINRQSNAWKTDDRKAFIRAKFSIWKTKNVLR